MRKLALLLVSAFLATVAFAKPEYPAMGNDIFDSKASGVQLVADAVAKAKGTEKNILLFFGANWCPWCRRLHAALSKDARVRAKLEERFIVVYLDANTRNIKNRNADLLEKYDNPTLTYGLPVFLLLDHAGKLLTIRETASIAAASDEEVGSRLLSFLNQWDQNGAVSSN